MSTVENKALLRRYIEEAFNQGNLAVIDAASTPASVTHVPGAPDVTGIAGAKQFVTQYRAAFPDLHLTIDDEVADGDMVVQRWTSRGTHRGAFQGLAPTGKQVTVAGMTMARLVGGKVAEVWASWDTLGQLQQLGAVPTPALATA